jgi:hypothetical protein
MFRLQVIKIRHKVLTAQINLLEKVRTIQNHFQMIEKTLENISSKEREVGVARVAFQEVVIATAKIETVNT